MTPADRRAWIATAVAAAIAGLAFIFLGDFYRASKDARFTELRVHAAKATLEAAIADAKPGDPCPILVVMVDVTADAPPGTRRLDTPFLDDVRAQTPGVADASFGASLVDTLAATGGDRWVGIGVASVDGFEWKSRHDVAEIATDALAAWGSDVLLLDFGSVHRQSLSARGVATEGGRRSAADYFVEALARLRARCGADGWVIVNGERRWPLSRGVAPSG